MLQLVCDNGIAEIRGKKMVAISLWQWHCRNRRKKEKKNCGNGITEIGGKKNLLQLVCDNGIAEIEGKKEKKNYGNWFVAMA